MDLTYTSGNMIPQGRIKPVYFDEMYGYNSENTFELHIPKHLHCLEKNSLVYVPNSDIGGLVDSVEVSTINDDIVYQGRTWAGVLNSKIIEPTDDNDFFEVSGDANTIVSNLILKAGLENLFYVSENSAEIDIPFYQFRYNKLYDGIISMLNSVLAKLDFTKTPKGVCLTISPSLNSDEELSPDNYDIAVKQTHNLVNHLICMGQGELADRAVIHLFTDENGGVMPYALLETPLMDKDYILDKSQQQIFGVDEITDVYDYSSADITYNYIPLTTKPSKWDTRFSHYYVQNEEDEFDNIDVEKEKVYELLSSAPSDWNKKYSNYYTKEKNDYDTVDALVIKEYKPLTKAPKKWSKKYGDYFEYVSDGVTGEYRKVSGISKHTFKIQTEKPTDWDDNFSSYYFKNKKGKFNSVIATKAPKFEKNKYYRKKRNGRYSYELLKNCPSDWAKNYSSYYYKKNSSYYSVAGSSAPKWKKKKYYTKRNFYVAPKFKADEFYKLVVKKEAPKFLTNKYYKKVESTIIPAFVANMYYKKVEDRYAVLVAEGIERLNELRSKQNIDVSPDEDKHFGVGDIIRASFNEFDVSAVQTVTAKRISYNENLNIFENNFEVGDL